MVVGWVMLGNEDVYVREESLESAIVESSKGGGFEISEVWKKDMETSLLLLHSSNPLAWSSHI